MASKNREAHSRKRKGDAFKEGQPSELELDKLAGKIGTKWKTLGLHLGISQDVLEGIEANEKDKPYEMLLRWRKTTDSAAPYGDLYHALCDDRVGLNNVAKEFCCVEMTAARKTVSKRGTEKMNKGEEEPLTEAGGEASAEKKYEEDKENTGKAAEYCEFIETKNTTEKTKSDLNPLSPGRNTVFF